MAVVRTATVPAAWVEFIRAQGTVRRRMDGRLLAEHGLTLSDYDVLLHLAQAPDRRLRRVDLSSEVALSQSGITRLLHGLESAGYVRRATCPGDARVVYAELTPEGMKKFRAAARTHVEDIESFFGRHFSPEELELLGDLLSRVGEGESLSCATE
jgi:DNA-binding MarR family transcriptional regulator